MHENRHACGSLVHAETPPLEVGVVVVEAGIHTLDRSEHAPLLRLRVVAGARAGGVIIQVIQQAAAVAVVQARTGEVAAVLQVGRAAETDFFRAIERRQRGDDRLSLALNKLTTADQLAGPLQRVRQVSGQAGLVCLDQAHVDFLPQCSAVGQALGHELVPQVKRDREGRFRRVFRDVLSQQTELGRLASNEFRVVWLDRFHRQGVGARILLGRELEFGRRLELGQRVAERGRQLRLERHQRRRGA